MQILINGIDVTASYVNKSLNVTERTGSDRSTFKFRLDNPSFQPLKEQNVEIYDTNSTTGRKIAAGRVRRPGRKAVATGNGEVIFSYTVECLDYARDIERRPPATTSYLGKTTGFIARDIIAQVPGLSNQFITTGGRVQKDFNSRQERLTSILDRLAAIEGWDWWVDCDKNVYFREIGSDPASFAMTDATWEEIAGLSLTVEPDTTDLVNRARMFYSGKYTGSTVNVFNASNTITDPNAKWLSKVSPGATFRRADSPNIGYTILAVDSDTSIRLTSNYAEPNASGIAYVIEGIPRGMERTEATSVEQMRAITGDDGIYAGIVEPPPGSLTYEEADAYLSASVKQSGNVPINITFNSSSRQIPGHVSAGQSVVFNLSKWGIDTILQIKEIAKKHVGGYDENGAPVWEYTFKFTPKLYDLSLMYKQREDDIKDSTIKDTNLIDDIQSMFERVIPTETFGINAPVVGPSEQMIPTETFGVDEDLDAMWPPFVWGDSPRVADSVADWNSGVYDRTYADASGNLKTLDCAFSRTGNAWDEAMVQWASNLPRFGGPDVEPTVNLALYSEQLDNAYWSKTLCTVTANATTAPDGTMTADKVMDTAAAGAKILFRGSVSTVGQPITFSVYAKAGELSWISPRVDNLPAWFDLANGVVGTVTAGLTASIQSVGDGWYRCTVSRSSVASVTEVSVRLNTANNQASYTGTGTQGVYIWGIQVEQKDHATPYVGATLGTPRARGILATGAVRNLLTVNQSNVETDTGGFGTTGTYILAGATIARTTNESWQGTASLSVSVTTGQGASLTPQTLLPNTAYTFSAYVKAPVGANVGVRVRDITNALNSTFTPVPGTGDWQRLSTTFVTGASAASCQPFVYYPDTGSITYYVDGLQMEEGYGATPWIVGQSNAAGVPYRNGILIEEGTTNLVQYSAALDNAWWTKNNSTVTADAVVAPDGTLTADKLIEDATNAAHYVSRATLFASGSAGTISAYLKAAERSWGILSFSGAGAYFDLLNGKVGTVSGAGTTATITPVGGGWFRCTVTQNPVAVASQDVRIFTATGDGVGTYTGTVGSGIYVWGIQAEQKGYATSLVPTSGANGVRNADNMTLSTQDLFSAAEWTVATRFYLDGNNLANPGVGFHAIFRHNLNTYGSPYDNGLVIGINTNTFYAQTTRNYAGTSATTTLQPTKASIANWKQGWHWGVLRANATELSLWFDGVKVASAATPILPVSFGAAQIANDTVNGSINRQLNAPLSTLMTINRSMTDAEVIALNSNIFPVDRTLKIDFSNGNVVPEVSGSWTGPWEIQYSKNSKKTAILASTVPVGATAVAEYRSGNYGQAVTSAWYTDPALVPDDKYYQMRVRMVSAPKAQPVVDKVGYTPVKTPLKWGRCTWNTDKIWDTQADWLTWALTGSVAVDASGMLKVDPGTVTTPAILGSLVNVTLSGANNNTITKTSGVADWNAGAFSTNSIPNGQDGYVEFRHSTASGSSYIMGGLSRTNPDAGYLSPEFMIYGSGGSLVVWEGSNKGAFGTYTASDVLRVSLEGTQVKYYKNGVLFYTSLLTRPTGDYYFDSTLYYVGDAIADVNMSIVYSLGTPSGTATSPWIPVTARTVAQVATLVSSATAGGTIVAEYRSSLDGTETNASAWYTDIKAVPDNNFLQVRLTMTAGGAQVNVSKLTIYPI